MDTYVRALRGVEQFLSFSLIRRCAAFHFLKARLARELKPFRDGHRFRKHAVQHSLSDRQACGVRSCCKSRGSGRRTTEEDASVHMRTSSPALAPAYEYFILQPGVGL